MNCGFIVYLALCSFLPPILSFKWELTDTLYPRKILTFSERYMFASGNGPAMLNQGKAYIAIDTTVKAFMSLNVSTTIGYATFIALDDHHHDSFEGMCGDRDVRDNYWAINAINKRTTLVYMGEEQIVDLSQNLNGTYYVYSASVKNLYNVQEEAWHNVAFQFCASESSQSFAKIDGSVTFRNPYGFIPAELYGFLPFEGARMVAYVLFECMFLYFYCKYSESVLNLHRAILLVFTIGLIEATIWYAAYQTINLSGQPYCCPFPPLVVTGLILQVFRQTLARVLLLVVSLGYGIVRPKLLRIEWIGISIVTVLYFVTATIAQVAEIVLVHDVHANVSTEVVPYQIPELFMDVTFLTWIYIALGSTIRILNDFRQTYKLLMYRQLAFVIGIFVGFFALVTVIIMCDKFGILSWPWQYAWVQQVLWEILNFAVLAAVCWVCRPSDNSKLLSYASQLPTEDPDNDDEGDDDDSDDNDVDKSISNFRSFYDKRKPVKTIEMKKYGKGVQSGMHTEGGEYGLGDDEE